MPKKRPLTNAQRQRRHYHTVVRPKRLEENPPVLCSICGGIIWGKYAIRIGVHQNCNKAEYMRQYRKLRQQEEQQ